MESFKNMIPQVVATSRSSERTACDRPPCERTHRPPTFHPCGSGVFCAAPRTAARWGILRETYDGGTDVYSLRVCGVLLWSSS